MGLFSRKPASPDLTCPRCGGPKPASLPACTTCKMSDGAAANPLGFPGSEKERAARQQGGAWTPPPTSRAPTPYTGIPAPGAPMAAAAVGDVYALSPGNYPHRAKSGQPVRSAAEAAVADYLYEKGVAVAYEPTVAGHRPTFLVPGRQTVIEVTGPGSPLTEWQRAERQAAYRAYGFSVVHVDASRGDARKEIERQLRL